MINPWLEIPPSDYENHMREIGQEQTLNSLTKYYLDKYNPSSFVLLGCSTGNGLEHVNPALTKKVYAVDINHEYLEMTRKRFQDKMKNLEIFQCDVDNDKLPFSNVDLIVAGLVLEYVKPDLALKKIVAMLNKNGVLAIIIQKNKETTAVSKSSYKSLEKLSGFFQEVDESVIEKLLVSMQLEMINREEIPLTKNKSFISLEYRLKGE